MRFLLGMCSGAVALLLLTGQGAVSGPDGALARGAEAVVPWLAEHVEAFAPPRADIPAEEAAAPDVEVLPEIVDAPPAAPPAETAAPSEATTATDAVAALWPEGAPLPEAFGDGYAWWARNVGEAAADPMPEVAAVPMVEADALEAAPAPAVSAETSAPAERAAAETVPEAPASQTASVWIPFHSERSAAGFAQRLSRALEHPFDVRREGPGRYQVVFPYEDATRRDEVLARVAMLTGTQQ